MEEKEEEEEEEEMKRPYLNLVSRIGLIEVDVLDCFETLENGRTWHNYEKVRLG